MNEEVREYSISALARELGVDRRTIARRLQGVPPCRVTGVGNLYKMRDVCVQVMAPGALAGQEGEETLNLEYQRARLAKSQADEKERTVRRLDAELVPLTDVEVVLSGIITTAKSRLLGLGARLAQQILAAAEAGPGSVQLVVDSATEEILNEMASVDLGVALDLPSRDDSGVVGNGDLAGARKTPDKPVGGKISIPKP